jgi:hypothetical protein
MTLELDKTSPPQACAACGHRVALHGLLLRDAWCIAWNGSTFCGCQIRPLPVEAVR